MFSHCWLMTTFFMRKDQTYPMVSNCDNKYPSNVIIIHRIMIKEAYVKIKQQLEIQ